MASSPGGSLLVRGLSPMLFWRLASFSVVIACGDDPAPAASCVPASYDTSCTPAHAPTYEAIYAATFQRSCAKSGVSCHGATGKQGGIDFDDKEQAYAALRARSVIAGDPACSDLVRRLVATDGTVRMPPGRSLPAGEQCAVIRWIEAGAGR